jgi:hypothetical protein
MNRQVSRIARRKSFRIDCRPRAVTRKAPPPKEPRQELVMAKRIVTTPTQASAGTKEGVVRYILGISIALVVVLFGIGYLFH